MGLGLGLFVFGSFAVGVTGNASACMDGLWEVTICQCAAPATNPARFFLQIFGEILTAKRICLNGASEAARHTHGYSFYPDVLQEQGLKLKLCIKSRTV